MRPLYTLLILSLYATSILMPVHALTYDPVTNTYISETTTETVEPDSTEETPNEDETTTEETSSTEETATTSEEESTQDETTTETTPEASSINSTSYDGPLASLHQLLEQYEDQLNDSVGSTYKALQERIATSDDTVSLQANVEVLQCVGVVDEEFAIINEIKTTQKDLRNKVGVVVADIHSEIAALETKIDQNLLDTFAENLEIAVVQNKVESVVTEYTNVIDMYFDLADSEIEELEADIATNNDAYQQVLRNYDNRKELFEDLEAEYEAFTKKSSFVGVVVGPSINELLEAVEEIKRFYRITYMGQWSKEIGNHISINRADFQEEARVRFNHAFSAYINNLLNDLYPLEELERINQEMLTIRAAYLQDDGTVDCRGLATNPMIDQSGVTVSDNMKDLLTKLNTSVNQVKTDDNTLPTTVEELQQQLLEYAQDFQTTELSILLKDEKTQISSDLTAGRKTSSFISSELKQEETIRTFLLTMYQQSIENDRVDSFTTKLRNAESKIEKVKPSLSGKNLTMIESIERVIKEFL